MADCVDYVTSKFYLWNGMFQKWLVTLNIKVRNSEKNVGQNRLSGKQMQIII